MMYSFCLSPNEASHITRGNPHYTHMHDHLRVSS